MAAKDFPASPVAGQVFENWVWNATNESWDSLYNGTPPAMLQVSKYADASARTTAIPTPAEGMITYLDDINQFQGYQGASWRGVGGLVPIVPPTVRYSGGSATANSLGTVSFTSVTSIGLDGVFTADYTNYKVVLNFACNAVQQLQMRYTASGTPDSANSYIYGGWWSRSTSTANSYYSSNGVTQFGLGFTGNDTAKIQSLSMDVYNPKLANKTTHTALSNGADASSFISVYTTGINTASTQFDGLYFFLSGAGNITGSVTCYGYNS